MQMWKQKPKQKHRGKPMPWRLLILCITIPIAIIARFLCEFNISAPIISIAFTVASFIVAVIALPTQSQPTTTPSTPTPTPQPSSPTPTTTPQPQPPPSPANTSNTTTTQATLNRIFYFNERLPKANEFYGRARERETLINRTRNGSSTSIVGPRRIGKTWLIDYLKHVAPTELHPSTRLVYLDATA